MRRTERGTNTEASGDMGGVDIQRGTRAGVRRREGRRERGREGGPQREDGSSSSSSE